MAHHREEIRLRTAGFLGGFLGMDELRLHLLLLGDVHEESMPQGASVGQRFGHRLVEDPPQLAIADDAELLPPLRFLRVLKQRTVPHAIDVVGVDEIVAPLDIGHHLLGSAVVHVLDPLAHKDERMVPAAHPVLIHRARHLRGDLFKHLQVAIAFLLVALLVGDVLKRAVNPRELAIDHLGLARGPNPDASLLPGDKLQFEIPRLPVRAPWRTAAAIILRDFPGA